MTTQAAYIVIDDDDDDTPVDAPQQRFALKSITNRKRPRSPIAIELSDDDDGCNSHKSESHSITLMPPRKKAKCSTKQTTIKNNKVTKNTTTSDCDATTTAAAVVVNHRHIVRHIDTERFANDFDEDTSASSKDDADADISKHRRWKFAMLRYQHHVYVCLSDIFRVAFKYNNHKDMHESKTYFFNYLRAFLRRYEVELDDVDDDQKRTFLMQHRQRYYITEKTFCILLQAMTEYDTENAHIAHLIAYRYYYRTRLFSDCSSGNSAGSTEQVGRPRWTKHVWNRAHAADSLQLCTVCFLDDVAHNFYFDTVCDCECALHLKCDALRITRSELDEADPETWFCPLCVATQQSMTILQQRRPLGSQSGEFEVQKVLDFDAVRELYVVKWKTYPASANCAIELSASFVGSVQEFWAAQIEKGVVKKIPARAQTELRALQEEMTQQMEELQIDKQPTQSKLKKDEQKKQTQKKKESVSGDCGNDDDEDVDMPATTPSETTATATEDADLIVTEDVDADVDADVDGDQNKQKTTRTGTHFGDKFIAVKLHEIMPPEHIVRRQKYTKDTFELQKDVVNKYRKYMQSEIKKRSAFGRELVHMMSRNEDGEEVLPKYALRSVHKDWDCSLPRIYDVIVALLSRRWSEWTHDVSNASFVIGDIIDRENPAKKYGAENGVHAQKAYGLFATQRIAKDSLLFEYAGCVRPIGVATQKLNHLETELSQTTLFDLIGHLDANRAKPHWGSRANDQLVIDPSKYHNEGVYMNDYRSNVMDDPDDDEQLEEEEEVKEKEESKQKKTQKHHHRQQNVKFYEVLVNNWPRVFAVAICDIEPGQELLGDYGEEFWKNFRVMMLRRQQLTEIKQAIHTEWQQKYETLQKECEEKQTQIEQLQKQLQSQED